VALLFTCGQSLEGPRLHTVTIDGAYARAVDQGIESQWYWVIAAADVDLDGDEEVLVLRDGSFGFMQADGDATTMLEVDASAGSWAPHASGDRADVFLWTDSDFGGGDDTTITHASCTLGAQPACTASATLTIAGPLDALTAGDFNEDGLVDVVTSSGLLTVHTSTRVDGSHPGWVEAGRFLIEPSTGSRHAVASADLDGDGHLDVVAAAGRLGVRLFFGAGDGTFGQIRPEIDDDIPWADAVHLADLDRDMLPEIVVVTRSSSLVVLRRLRERTFGDAGFPSKPIDGPGWSTLDVLPGDFDGDGSEELLVAHWADPPWLAELGGKPRGWTVTRLSGDSGELRLEIDSVAADLEGDGRDVVAQLFPRESPVECALGGAAARRR
jgi:FG-GAP-like repeat